MKQCFTNKCGLALVLLLFAFVQGAWAQGTKKTPTVTFSQNSYSVTVGGSITPPQVQVSEEGNTTPIRSRFKYTYNIVDASNHVITNLVTVNGKDATKDPTTGSSVTYRYGNVVIGKNSGSFKVRVTVAPTDRYKDQYNSATADYTVTVEPANPTMSVAIGTRTLTADNNTVNLTTYQTGGAWKSTNVPMPTVTLSHEMGSIIDDTEYYTISTSFASGDKFNFLTSKDENENDIKTAFESIAGAEEATGTLTITATPTEEGEKVVGNTVKTFTIRVKSSPLSGTDKIATNIKFPKNVLEHYRCYRINTEAGYDYRSLDPIITDNNGNDVTTAYDIKFGYYPNDNFTSGNFVYSQFPGMDVLHQYSDDPWDSYLGWKRYTDEVNKNIGNMYDFDKRSFFGGSGASYVPDDYVVQVEAKVKDAFKDVYAETPATTTNTIQGMLYGKEKEGHLNENVYTLPSNAYIMRLNKRGPSIEFTPEPSSVKLANNYKMNPMNRFIVEGYFNDNTMPALSPDPVVPTDSVTYKNSKWGQFGYCFFVPWEYDNDNPDHKKGVTIQVRYTYTTDWGTGAKGEKTIDEGDQKESNVYQYIYDLDDNGNIQYENGNPKMTRVIGTRYYTKRDWGNDDFSITFFGEGKLPLNYTLLPYNSTHWDAGTSMPIVYNIVNQEPTYIKIDPQELVTTVNNPSPSPRVWVEDQFGKDVTEYFDLTPSKKDENQTFNISTSGDDKYSVTAATAGEYVVKVTGSRKKAEDGKTDIEGSTHYAIPVAKETGDDEYTVTVTSATTDGKALYEVIYDSKEFNSNGLNDTYDETTKSFTSTKSKMGKLHFINSGDFNPGTASFREVPGLNLTFGTADEGKGNKALGIEGTKYTVTQIATDSKDLSDNCTDNTSDAINGDNSTRSYLLLDGTTVPDGKDLPVTGFIRLDPITNGFLTIDARFRSAKELGTSANELWIIRDASTGQEQELTASGTETQIGEKRYGLPLLAGHTYELWSDQMSGYIHGLSFEPSFIALATDHVGWHTAVTFQNGYTGALPKLRKGNHSTITYYVKDVTAKGQKVTDITTADNETGTKGKGGYHASIGQNNGSVAAHELSTDNTLTSTSGAEMINRVTIVGSVKGKKYSDDKQVEKRPHYNLFIGNMPTYIVEDGANFDQGNRISTNNIPTRIWMTIGGWAHVQDEKYPYQKTDSKTGAMVFDSWKTAKMDSVGRDNMTIDNFNYGSFGDQNPNDEDVKSWSAFREAKPWNLASNNALKSGITSLSEQRTTFNLPVRGTYLKFEPEESGRIFLYILQNGMSDLSKGDDNNKFNKKDSPQYLRRRALYIVDETGNNVDIKDGNDGWSDEADKYLPTGQTAATRFPGYTIPNKNYYCDGITRVVWGNEDNSEKGIKKFEIDDSKTGKYSWTSNYDHIGAKESMELTDQGQKDFDADKKLVENWWKGNIYTAKGARTTDWTYNNGANNKLDGPNEVLRLSDGGFVVPTKGYVRYTFNVKAGKTYYVFVTGSKLGFCGFGFLPQGYTIDANPWLDATNGIENPLIGDPNNSGFIDAVYAKLPNPDGSYGSGSTTVNDNVYDKKNFGGKTITLDANKKSGDDGSYSKQIKPGIIESDATDHEFVNVNLNRTFKNKRWHGICLPFSVTETQVKKVFGSKTQIITFDSIRWNPAKVQIDENTTEVQQRTIHFTRHVTQLLEAGRPYFIYPDSVGLTDGQAFTYSDGTNTVNGVQFKQVTFENVPAKEVIGYNEKVMNGAGSTSLKEDTCFTYKIVGIYDKTQIPFYSYYMKTGSSSSDNQLVRVVPKNENSKAPYLPGYNAYLYPYSKDADGNETDLMPTGSKTSAKVADFWITGGEVAGNNGGTVTAIDQLVEDINIGQTNFAKGVYNLDGVKVNSKSSLEGLAPGVYIMGGKKYTVK